MVDIPTPTELRRTIGAFDATRKRVFGAMIVHMLENTSRIRDREWVAEQFTATTALALDLDLDAKDAQDGLDQVRAYAAANMDAILNAAFGVFMRVAQSMESRRSGFTFQDAADEALGYLAGGATPAGLPQHDPDI